MSLGISNLAIYGGTFINQTNSTFRAGWGILLGWIAPGAFYNSGELYDEPKCHPHTRVAVIDDIMQWVDKSHIEGNTMQSMLWLFGPAGAGKSAIAKRTAEIAAEKGLLIATFFFSRTSPARNSKDPLVATLAYQLALSIPDTRTHIEDAIERDPAIFMKNIQVQIDTLLIKPLQLSTQVASFPKLFIIDGLDECEDRQAQISILDAISRSLHQCKLSIIFLVVSRPEQDLSTSFNSSWPLKHIHSRLALDDSYQPDSDIRLFFSDKFKDIKDTHPLRLTIPTSWPTQQALETLVRKSSGQFIYAATVVRFVESNRHRPTGRLDIILGIKPPGNNKSPFAELDALYHHILSSVDDIKATLSVLSLYLATPYVQIMFQGGCPSESVDKFLSLEEGAAHLVLTHLSSIISYDESSGEVNILHASFVDFLVDRHRSTVFHIDIESASIHFVHRIFECIKAPDGIRAGDVDLLWGLFELIRRVPKDQFRSDISTFDLDAFMKSVNERYYNGPSYSSGIGNRMVSAFRTWTAILASADLEDDDRKRVVDRCNKSLESRLQKYQSDPRLQLLLIFAAININTTTYLRSEVDYWVPSCRCMDILLNLDDHSLHLADQRALDLRHAYRAHFSSAGLVKMITPFVDGDRYAVTALHCMRFLSKPPLYSRNNDNPEMGIIYAEWRATCDMTLGMLCKLLQGANPSPELVRFISNHDIHSSVQKRLPVVRVWWVDVHILAFLSRINVCVNWRIISVIQRAPDRSRYNIIEDDASIHERDTVRPTLRVDQCCVKRHLT